MDTHKATYAGYRSISTLNLFPVRECRRSSGIRIALLFLSALLISTFAEAEAAYAQSSVGKAASGTSTTELFGSVAVRFGPIRSAPWQRLTLPDTSPLLDECIGTEGHCTTPLGRDVAENRAQRLRMSKLAMISDVNATVNRIISYRSDREAYGALDHWASFEETARNGSGDCEDYAIAKMRILQVMGISLNTMRLVVLLDSRRGRFHAILALRMGEEWLVLDNASDRIRRDTDIGHYLPAYSLSAEGSWIHGFRSRQQITLGPLDSVYPGEAPQ